MERDLDKRLGDFLVCDSFVLVTEILHKTIRMR